MTCPTTDARECMLRHSHARHHRDAGPCLACKTGISRMSRPVELPQAAPAAVTPPPMVTPDAVRQVVRDALPLAEACALGLWFLAERCEAEAAQIRAALESAGLTIFKNEIAFQGRHQPCVSVNKRLRQWAT